MQNGRFSVRTSKTLHKQLVMQAKSEGVSLNVWVNMLLEQGVFLGFMTEALFKDAVAATVPQDTSQEKLSL